MALAAEDSPQPRRRLSRQLVLERAVEMADRQGIEAVSMRRLAQELGVEAMSLYHWFGKKTDIYQGMLEAVWAEVELPPAGEDWRPALRGTARSWKSKVAISTASAPAKWFEKTPIGNSSSEPGMAG